MIQNVWWNIEKKKWIIRGQEFSQLAGRTSFDWASTVSYHYAGRGDDVPGGALNIAEGWIGHCQGIFDREDVVMVVFNEEDGWSPCPGDPPPCMFGQELRDQGIWNLPQLRELAERGARVRPEHVTSLNKQVIEFAFKMSHETGCIFDWCIDATLKGEPKINVGSIDHIIRQTASLMRGFQEKYPNAAFLLRARNEWDTHREFPVSLDNVNMWAKRMYRWKKGTETRQSFSSPGLGWEAEQWPEAFFIVDHGGRNSFDYDVGPEPSKYKLGNIHIERRSGSVDWRRPVETVPQLRIDSRGQPIGANETMYAISKEGTLHWYRNKSGYNVVYEDKGLRDQMIFYQNNVPLFDYLAVHDDIGKKADATWSPGGKFEAALAEFYGGRIVVPRQRRYARIIEPAYQEILGRDADEGGLDAYNAGIKAGLTEAGMRDSLMRSEEYERKNPEE